MRTVLFSSSGGGVSAQLPRMQTPFPTVNKQTGVKKLPCPKLCLRAVKKRESISNIYHRARTVS